MRGPSSTDRQRTGKIVAERPSVGVDTLTFRGPVEPRALHDLPVQRQRTDLDVITGEVATRPTSSDAELRNGIILRADARRGQVEARVEASLPRLLHGHNCDPIPIGAVAEMVEQLYAQASEWVAWRCEPGEVTLMRLDLVRDFQGIEDPRGLLSQLAQRPISRLKTTSHSNAGDAKVEALYRHNTRWAARLYDRSGAYRDLARSMRGDEVQRLRDLAEAEAGKVRYELQLRSRFLSDRRISKPTHLLEHQTTKLAFEHFRRSGYDVSVGGGHAKLEGLVSALRTTGAYKQLPSILGQVFMDGSGLPQAASVPKQRKYRLAAASVGLTAADLSDLHRPEMCLDFDRGLLVVRDGQHAPDLPLRAHKMVA